LIQQLGRAAWHWDQVISVMGGLDRSAALLRLDFWESNLNEKADLKWNEAHWQTPFGQLCGRVRKLGEFATGV